jgi:pilus assembly protein Flp/PilA
MRELFVRLVREEDGQDLIEYALLAAFISLVSFLAMQAVGTGVNTLFNDVKGKLDQAVAAAP